MKDVEVGDWVKAKDSFVYVVINGELANRIWIYTNMGYLARSAILEVRKPAKAVT